MRRISRCHSVGMWGDRVVLPRRRARRVSSVGQRHREEAADQLDRQQLQEGRVLDVIDDMLRAGFIGMSDRLGQQYDR